MKLINLFWKRCLLTETLMSCYEFEKVATRPSELTGSTG